MYEENERFWIWGEQPGKKIPCIPFSGLDMFLKSENTKNMNARRQYRAWKYNGSESKHS